MAVGIRWPKKAATGLVRLISGWEKHHRWGGGAVGADENEKKSGKRGEREEQRSGCIGVNCTFSLIFNYIGVAFSHRCILDSW